MIQNIECNLLSLTVRNFMFDLSLEINILPTFYGSYVGDKLVKKEIELLT